MTPAVFVCMHHSLASRSHPPATVVRTHAPAFIPRAAAMCALACMLVACGESSVGAASPDQASNEATPATPATPDTAKTPQPLPKTMKILSAETPMTIELKTDKLERTDAQWKAQLTPEQYRILRAKGTERAFTGKYWNSKEPGVYRCAGCDQPLFVSDAKFDSGCGWPSFFKPVAEGVIKEHVDTSHGMVRTEVTCARCGGHLGHVFDDAPHMPTGLRYCINSVSIEHQAPDAAPAPSTPQATPPATTSPDSTPR